MLDLIDSDTRRALLGLIKRRGSLSVDAGMEALDLARTTVREHMMRLERQGLVERFAVPRDGRGRPRHRYRLTGRAHALFPSRDKKLMGELLAFLREQGEGALVERFFQTYWDERTQRVRAQLAGVQADDAVQRLDVLRHVLEEEGFMPEIDATEDEIVIRECNCPFPEAVKQTRLPCRLEADFFEALFDEPAERVSYIPDGNAACTYTFSGELTE